MSGQWDPTAGWTFPGQRAARERELDLIAAAARSFWDRRGVRAERPSELLVADSLGDADVGTMRPRARGQDGRVILEGGWAGARLAELRSGRPRAQVRGLRSLYEVLAHEEGHARGLPHSEGGIMREGHLPTPGDWKRLARELGIRRFPPPRRPRGRGVGVG